MSSTSIICPPFDHAKAIAKVRAAENAMIRYYKKTIALTIQIPHEVWIAIPRNSEPPRLDFPPIRVSRLTDVAFKTGIEKHAVDGKMVSVYSREKTLADCFSRRNKVGLDVAIEALKFYMAQGNVKVDLIMEYATKLRVAKTMRPYLEALL